MQRSHRRSTYDSIRWCGYTIWSWLEQLLSWHCLLQVMPYSRKFSLVQNFAKMPSDSSEEIFAMSFFFAEWMCDALTTPLPVVGLTGEPRKRHWTTKWSSLCNDGLVFILCGSVCNYESIRPATVGEKLACWTEGFSTADLNFDNFGASLTGSLAFCTLAGWFFSTVTI